MKVIILNGPPGCGKDYAAEHVSLSPEYNHKKLSQPLKDIVAQWLNIRPSELEKIKDVRIPPIGLSYREYQIGVFHALAHVLGSDWLGKTIVGRINNSSSQNIIMSDGGREQEIRPIIDAIGPKNILLIHVQRDGCTFENDIRSYIEMPAITTVQVFNDGTDAYLARIMKVIEQFETGTP